MERMELGYAPKCIPTASKEAYLNKLLVQTEKFIHRIEWKTYFFLNPGRRGNNKRSFGFKSESRPDKPEPLLADFKRRFTYLITNIEHYGGKSNSKGLQKRMRDHLNLLKREERVLIPADKTQNKYLAAVPEYKEQVKCSVESEYRKIPHRDEKTILLSHSKLATDLQIADRAEVTNKAECYVTIKDHKEGFPNKISTRLINPAKPELGRIAKIKLEEINNSLR